jgi:hypothetical protein
MNPLTWDVGLPILCRVPVAPSRTIQCLVTFDHTQPHAGLYDLKAGLVYQRR